LVAQPASLSRQVVILFIPVFQLLAGKGRDKPAAITITGEAGILPLNPNQLQVAAKEKTEPLRFGHQADCLGQGDPGGAIQVGRGNDPKGVGLGDKLLAIGARHCTEAVAAPAALPPYYTTLTP